MREESRRGSALIPQGAARRSPGWLRRRGRRREAGWAGGERERGRGGGGGRGGGDGGATAPGCGRGPPLQPRRARGCQLTWGA